MAQEEKSVPPVGSDLDPTQIEAVGGSGLCDADLVRITEGLKQAYENLIEFTTYVIERVAGPTP
jgi:hypothetical protein